MLSSTKLTTDAGAATRDLHDRIPVILDEAAMSLWTERANVHMAADLDDRVQLTPVSPQMNSPRYEEPDCIAPFGPIAACH
jgi:putative SOS response-associated peptidase YedK